MAPGALCYSGPKMSKFAVIALFVAAVSGACSGDPAATRDEHIRRGDEYLAKNQISQAVIEYRGAVQADGRSGPARLKLGNAYVQAKDLARANDQFVRAADLMPDDMSTQLRAGQVLLMVGRFDDARARAEKVLAKTPGNVEAHILKGNALAGLKDFEGALAEVNEAIQTDPTKSESYAHLGAIQFAHGDVSQAEAAFKRALFTDRKSATAWLALGNLYWSTNRRREAEEALKEAVKLDPTNVWPNQALATLYLGSKRMAEAEAPLKLVAEHSTSFEGKIMLADYYANVRRIDEARAIYEQVAKGGDGMATAQLRLASLGLLQGDRAGAYRLIDEVLRKDSMNAEALVARAQLQFADGQRAEALASARAAAAADPGSPHAPYVLGLILKSQYQLEDAKAAFEDALRRRQGFAPANVELARLAISSGRYVDAVAYAQAAINTVPGYGEAHLLLARANMANGNAAAAEAPIKVMVSNFPDSPQVQAELGLLLLAKSEPTRASEAFTRALAKDPLQVAALGGMITLDVQQKRGPAARKRLEEAVAAAPKNAELQLMAAQVYATTFGDFPAAEAAVKRVLAVDANNLVAFGLLARIYVQTNNLQAATTEFEKLAQKQPKSVFNQTAIGMLYYLQNRPGDAKAAFERALALDPRAPVAANNLAQLYSDRNENLDVAVQLAKTAKAGLPASHEVDDTLGWLYYKKGLAYQAIGSLRSAVAAQPENPIYLYHLGAAYALNKDKTNARHSLEKALQRGNFDGIEDARRMLDSLK